ncbi:hypothetical protein DPMN_115301 [Dreissena polymorpha]|uniref:Uncharacterized protein n=1 Tax=Dreissena polymorpha TaxID=45954 RepID=A0A9D4KKY4_DREPO|nr:hypothetical protein DPMN_115301 [Dreissena polymorpha]
MSPLISLWGLHKLIWDDTIRTRIKPIFHRARPIFKLKLQLHQQKMNTVIASGPILIAKHQKPNGMTYDTFNKRETQMHINQTVMKTSGATALNRTIHGKLNYIMVKPEQQAITD